MEQVRRERRKKPQSYCRRDEREQDELVYHHVPDDWPENLIYTSTLIWEVSEEMQQKYKEYSLLSECSKINFTEFNSFGLFAHIDLQETCLLDEYTGFIVSDADFSSSLLNPHRVFLHFEEEREEYLWIDSTEIGNETRFIRRVPQGSPTANCRLQHIIYDGELRVFVELTRDVKSGEEFVLEHFIPRHLHSSEPSLSWKEPSRDEHISSSKFLQMLRYGHTPQLIYDKLEDSHPFLAAKRCLWDYVVIGDITEPNHPCFGERGCFARVFMPKGDSPFFPLLQNKP